MGEVLVEITDAEQDNRELLILMISAPNSFSGDYVSERLYEAIRDLGFDVRICE
jgi:hypothetical protein